VRRLLHCAALLAGLAGRGAAQDSTAAPGPPDSTAALLGQAREFYERLDLERVVPLLQRVVSPAWPFAVTPDQRVEAYKYLGAALALSARHDSAVAYFRQALERDPFLDLDPLQFTPGQIAVLAAARRSTFAVGARPVTAARVEPRAQRVTFMVATTHVAAVRVELRSGGAAAALVLFRGVSDGVRELRWDGLLADGRLAPPGRYQLAVAARSELLARSDSARVYFDVGYDTAPLEDTLPELHGGQLLPERHSTAMARGDLLKGLGVAAGAVTISTALANRDLGRDATLSAMVAGTAGVAGVVAFLDHLRQRPIPENAATNVRRQAERRAANEAIRSRNAARLAQTILVVSPAPGVGP